MKILYVDPWCFNGSNLYYYSTGLVGAISKIADVTLVCCHNCDIPNGENYKAIKLFFPKSNDMKDGKVRLATRGIEYISAYNKILNIAKMNKFDIIHVEWPLLYSADAYFYRKLKKYCMCLSLKAHNILPHSTQDKYIKDFERIYGIADVILVHGDNMKQEFSRYFPNMKDKVKIQHHGVYLNFDRTYDISEIDSTILQKVSAFKRVYLFCGRIDYDKGLDRLTKIWNDNFKNSDSLLIIAGKSESGFDFESVKNLVSKQKNVLIYEGYVPDNLLNYFIASCNLVILPYRAGSMSGVVFTASEFSKPILSTEFGVIGEYIINEDNSYLVENDDDKLKEKLVYIDSKVLNSELSQMGTKLNQFISHSFSWNTIGELLVNETYATLLETK